MRALLAILLIGSLLTNERVAGAGPLEDGQVAANRNDFETALKFWRPLADIGDADAQSRIARKKNLNLVFGKRCKGN